MCPGEGRDRAAEAERIEQLAEDVQEGERLQRRHDGLRQRLQGSMRDTDALAQELQGARREERRVRRGLVGLGLWLTGARGERLEQAQGRVARLERRQRNRTELEASLEAEIAESHAEIAARRPLEELRTALRVEMREQRRRLERDAPKLVETVAVLEAELPQARSEYLAAIRALTDLDEIEELLREADEQLGVSLSRGLFESFVSDDFLTTRSKYARIDAAAWRLRHASSLLHDLPPLASARGELEPLDPSIGTPMRILDYLTDSVLVNVMVMRRTEECRAGIAEARELCGTLRPMLEKALLLRRTRAENLEQRWREVLLSFLAADATQLGS